MLTILKIYNMQNICNYSRINYLLFDYYLPIFSFYVQISSWLPSLISNKAHLTCIIMCFCAILCQEK